jgi:magnesium chelatase family protein
MSLAIVHTRSLVGVGAAEVTVEVHLAPGLPGMTLVGLPEAEVREARDRVRAAIQFSGYQFPSRRITVNLAPADLPKESGRFDLPIAVGILAASAQVDGSHLGQYEFAGELALSGELRPVRGALALCAAAVSTGRRIILPAASAAEASLVRGITLLPAGCLADVCNHLAGTSPLLPAEAPAATSLGPTADLAEVRGQAAARRALEVAAAGAHSLLMCGPPGTGKSMLAERLPGILPPMTEAEAIESARIQSVAGRFRAADYGIRPVIAPHHSASVPALVGGGNPPTPGEISLAHLGVLFTDELPEFDRRVLEALREPLESGAIRIARAGGQAEFPARFQWLAAMNPCPCGYLGEPRCRCTPDQIARYRHRLSGPLLDRIDLQVDVPAVTSIEMAARSAGENSATVRGRVCAARERQLARQGIANAWLSVADIECYCRPDPEATRLLQLAMAQLRLSARGYHRILKVARSIADLAGVDVIGSGHLAEAIQYRRGLARPD